MITHLQFADDTLIFLDANKVELSNLLNILITFEDLTRMNLNLEKSLISGVHKEISIKELTNILDCGSSSL